MGWRVSRTVVLHRVAAWPPFCLPQGVLCKWANVDRFDVAVIGAGAAGMMCAAVAGRRGRSVVLVDHATKIGEKIRISGGGRCNFTNREVGPGNFVSDNPRFCRSALAGYPAAEFIALVKSHGIAFHEKHRGQLFCDGSAQDIIGMLERECEAGAVAWRTGCAVAAVRRAGDRFMLDVAQGAISAHKVVVATGGLSIPKSGATDFGYSLARRMDIAVVEPRPGLVPLTIDGQAWQPFVDLAGVALEVDIECEGRYGCGAFREDLMFTHRGLSGPAALQISNFLAPGGELSVNLASGVDWDCVIAGKRVRRGGIAQLLAESMPRRLADAWAMRTATIAQQRVADLPDRDLRQLADSVTRWCIRPGGTEGFRKAEVTLGGVDTRELSSQTMQANKVPGLYFIGEVVDVTGWLGGYNFQWAWASGVACGRAL